MPSYEEVGDEELRKLEEEKYKRYLYEMEMRRLQRAAMEEARRREEEATKRAILLTYVDEDVRQRIYNIRAANPALAAKIEQIIIALLQSGRVSRIDFETFKRIVESLKRSK